MRINNGNHLAPVCTEILLHLDRIGEEALVPLFKKVYFPEWKKVIVSLGKCFGHREVSFAVSVFDIQP